MGTELIIVGTKVILRRINKWGCIIEGDRVAYISVINSNGTYVVELDAIGSKKNLTIYLRNIKKAFNNDQLVYEYDIRIGD